jgi:WD40 repeat protein
MACHSGTIKESRFDMGSYESLVKGGKRGAAVVPGKAESSILYRMSGHTQKPVMPPEDEEPLTPEELALVKMWIDQGAKAPSGERVRQAIIVSTPPASVHPVRALAVSPDKAAVAVGRGNQILVYDAGSGTYIRSLLQPGLQTPDKKEVRAAHLSLVESLAFSPDGKYLASGSFQEVCVWDVQSGLLAHKLTGFAHNVVALSFAPNSKLLATGGGVPSEDGEIKVFEACTWNLVTNVKNGHSDTVYGVSFNPDGSKLATCSADKFIKVFELPSGKFIKSFEGHTHHVLDVGWRGDGKLLASAGADNTVKVWDYEKGEQVRTIPAHGKQVTRLLFIGKTPQFVTCSGDAQVRFWNADNGGNVRNFGGNTDFVYAVGVSPDGSVVAAGGEEGVVRVYNGNNGQLARTLAPPK